MRTYNTTGMPHLDATQLIGYSPAMRSPNQELFPNRPPPLRTNSIESASSYSDMEDRNQTITPQQRPQRSRRRPQSSPEHVKHRRTRSGCYTCRQRRVKCDEARPVCDRCRKGKRECTYPDSTSVTSKQGRATVKSDSLGLDSVSSASGEDADGPKSDVHLEPVDSNDDPTQDDSERMSATTGHTTRQESDVVSGLSTSWSPFSTTTTSQHPAQTPTFPTMDQEQTDLHDPQSTKWTLLPSDIKLLLHYHCQRLSHRHYGFTSDYDAFLKTTFIDIAMEGGNEALLHAVLAFASYHRTFAQDNSGIYNFLTHYNQSINLLQQTLKRPNVTTLLTILQLATIEEFLGDWVNLIAHQKACHQIVNDLFTPQTIMENETSRQIIRWYLRFDMLAGTLSGSEACLEVSWYEAYDDYYKREARARPFDHGIRVEECLGVMQLLVIGLSRLVTARSTPDTSHDQLEMDSNRLIQKLDVLRNVLETEYTSSANLIEDRLPDENLARSTSRALGPELMFSRAHFAMNFVLLHFGTVQLMIGQGLPGQHAVDLERIALKQIELIDAVLQSHEDQSGALIVCQSDISVASAFLPNSEEYITWSRKRFSEVEQLGYIYPAALHERMSRKWGIDVVNSWLPDDTSNQAARNVREFINYRKTVPEASLDSQMRHLNGIFANLYSDR